jgi:putative membrane protein
MIGFIVHLLVSAVLLLFIGRIVKGIEFRTLGAALLAALVLGVANAIIRPLLVILTFPITILTLGLFLLVINALMLMLTAAIVPNFRIKGFLPALIGALILSVLNLILSLFGL